ncbi:MAG: hypothetical protein VR65_17370 [Desulfobulbaceae bacterium BRH_c16a]|nr:MAG: hypothetical protein VR65_17370 [Desulfobulbaceae bacterium BRH_c16a]
MREAVETVLFAKGRPGDNIFVFIYASGKKHGAGKNRDKYMRGYSEFKNSTVVIVKSRHHNQFLHSLLIWNCRRKFQAKHNVGTFYPHLFSRVGSSYAGEVFS